jgi:iron-sulfur cluster assembly protein
MAFLSPLQNTFNKIYTDLKQMKSPVTISEKAAIEIKKILNSKNIPANYGLRIGVKGGGCGVSFVLGFDKVKEDDTTYDLNDIPVYVQKKQLMFLIGKGVDFYEGADARGFFFH